MSVLKGVYVLVVSVSEDTSMNVGALGKMTFRKGLYAYVGSAQNDLEKRLERHLRKVKRKFWHIDYLLSGETARVLKVFYKKAKKSEECEIARKLGERSIPTKGFGCSDCACKSHLFRIEDYHSLEEFMLQLEWKCKRNAF